MMLLQEEEEEEEQTKTITVRIMKTEEWRTTLLSTLHPPPCDK